MSITDVFTAKDILYLLQQSRTDLGYNNPRNKDKKLPCCYKDTAWIIELKTGLTVTHITLDTKNTMHIQGYIHGTGYNGSAKTSTIIIEGANNPEICQIGMIFCDSIKERKQNCELGSKMGCDSVPNAYRVKTILEKRL